MKPNVGYSFGCGNARAADIAASTTAAMVSATATLRVLRLIFTCIVIGSSPDPRGSLVVR